MANREKTAEIMFETFEVPRFLLAVDSVMAMFAAGRDTGVTVGSGAQVTNVVPIYEGYPIRHAAQVLKLGGYDVGDYMVKLLMDHGVSLGSSTPSLDHTRRIAYEMLKSWGCVALNPSGFEDETKSYELDDGQVINVTSERFQAPEILFDPSIIGVEQQGIPKLVTQAIDKIDDLQLTEVLYKNVVLEGGNTMFQGIGERLTKELVALAPSSIMPKVVVPPERKYSVWIGASIYATLSTTDCMWITKDEYHETGGDMAIRRKIF
eukprot:TRINITY_DN11804_c0_g3_i1.p1 TRINITY_DN11804_c0_g3~~TRINITY_DN11804_c0_g3_i1.p1  ORF type:complete len:297 (+),score=70.02 TRINITY_DN11804_c0_g3_i1:101-892(+)